jgi:DNA invertase Pin-like site-specific DNA recombinase
MTKKHTDRHREPAANGRHAEPALAYSYLRFSHPEQAKGDSIRRQTELRDAWLARNNVRLDTSLTLEDRGVSGFRGKHRENPDKHGLAAFLQLVQQGKVARGSYLLIENLDRLSREEEVPACHLLTGILMAGIRIVQLSPSELVLTDKSNGFDIMRAVMDLSRGHGESEMKSKRNGAAWENKRRKAREQGTPTTSKTPSWLRLVEGEWKVLHEAAATVQRIFRMAADGHGIGVIAKRLNAEQVPAIGKARTWVRSYVGKILANRAVLGEHQPHKGRGRDRKPDGKPIEGYYPEIIKPEEWHAARKGMEVRKGKSGRPASGGVNIFAGLLRDARDGGTLHLLFKGHKQGNRPGGPVLTPYHAESGIGARKAITFPARVFEWAVLDSLREIKPEHILPAAPTSSRADVLQAQLDEVAAEIEQLKARVKARYSDALADVLEQQEAEHERIAAELEEAQTEEATPLSAAWSTAKSLLDVLDEAAAGDPAEGEEVRVRLRAALRRIVEGIWCLFVPGEDRLARWQESQQVLREAGEKVGMPAPEQGVAPRSRDRIAEVQVWFRGGAFRSYLVLYRSPCRGAAGGRPGRMHALSFRLPGAATKRLPWALDDLCNPDLAMEDLRSPKQARDVVAFLEMLPQSMIDTLLDEQGQDVPVEPAR